MTPDPVPIPRLHEIVFDPTRDIVGEVVGEVTRPNGTTLTVLRLADGSEVESLPFFQLATATPAQLAEFRTASGIN